MVYLVRTIRMLKFDDGIMEKTKDLMEHIRKTGSPGKKVHSGVR